MAITIAEVTGQIDANIHPGLKAKALKITCGAYTSGGEACDLSSYFPNKVFGGSPINDCDGIMMSFEPGTGFDSASGLILLRYTTSTLDKAVFPTCDNGEALTGKAGVLLFYGN